MKILNLHICLFILLFFSSCKKYSYTHETESTVSKTNQILYEEIKNLHIKGNYKTNPIKSLDIKFQNFDFKIRYIEDRAYIQYSIGNKIIHEN